MTKVFVDSSVLYSACYSPTGASREIIRQGISGKIKLVISKHVIEEVERNLKKDVPEAIPVFQEFLNIVAFKVVHPTKQEVEEAASCVDLKDAPILAAARNTKVEIVLPGEFLKRTRN